MYSKNETGRRDRKVKEYSISHVSKIVNLSQKTIRDYEKMGLIKPRRQPRTNNRIYSDFEIEQIQHISHLIHKDGFTLPCIQRIMRLSPCWNIFECKVKENCPAFQYATTPCYAVRKEKGTLCKGSCEQCGIFINRFSKKGKILKGLQ